MHPKYSNYVVPRRSLLLLLLLRLLLPYNERERHDYTTVAVDK
ncbi:MAG TPA: hypothetical protein PKH93_02315 [Chitinophagales bacterium]|nr:hypothetical protein [Chitinophagales bacterium]